MESDLKDMIGGSLRPSDPRRYLIEAMIAAMHADGRVDPRELEVLHRHLAEHELFAELPPATARVLIELATDAVRHAHDGRVGAIARGLPGRIHRLAAYAMACEVCTADLYIHEREEHYMHALRRGLHLGADESRDLFEGAKQGLCMDMLARKIDRLGQLMPHIIECFALQHCMERRVLKRHRKRLHDFLTSLMDIRAGTADIQRELDRALDPLNHSQNVPRALARLGMIVSDPADRYWFAVYIAAGYVSRDLDELLQDTPFWQALGQALGPGDASLTEITEHARRLLEQRTPA